MSPTDRPSDLPIDRRRRIFHWSLLLVVSLSIIYGVTLQVDINGSANKYTEDTGEFQNVLTQWGVPHPTGYPLYSLTGSAFASSLRLIGVVPAAAASAYSDFVMVLAMLGIYLLLCEWLIRPPLAVGTTLLAALLFPFWFHAVVAEVYALLTAFMALMFLIAARWRIDRDPRHLTQLAFAFGLAFGHHRLAVVALPALAVYIGPLMFAALRERPLRFVTSTLAVLASTLIYLYLPLRAGSAWVYGDPGAWPGLWRIITAREYNDIIRPASSASAFEGGFAQSMAVLLDSMTWPLLFAGVTGLGVGLFNRARRLAVCVLITLAATTIAFVSILSAAVFMPAALMSAMLALVLGVGFLLQAVADRGRVWLMSGAVALIVGVLALIRLNGMAIWSITHDSYSRELINSVGRAQLDQVSPRPVVFSIWGRDYFALSFAHSVTGELSKVEMVDSHADVGNLIRGGQTMYVVPAALYYEHRSIDWWDKRLGRAYLNSFDGQLVNISDRPTIAADHLPNAVPMGSTIELRSWAVNAIDQRSWQLTLYWQALAKPDRDYSVFVHASDRDVIDGPEAIIAQADSDAPVFGWYPTSRWQPNEIVRDDHLLVIDSDRPLKTISVGLYFQDETGAFHNLGQQIIPIAFTP